MTRNRRYRLAWLTGHVAVMALLAPASVLAADPPAVGGTPGAATLLVILLLGSVTAGIFFASPLPRRLGWRAKVDSTAPSTTAQPGVHERSLVAGVGRPLRPLTIVLARAQSFADGVLDAIGEVVADRGRRVPTPQPATPLPPMLGGDIFFEEGPLPAPSEGGQSERADADPSAASPWSTSSASDDRYWPGH
ncbi:hypothetical protein BH23CHL7_BH23CHL7_20940 [soil metagenome]